MYIDRFCLCQWSAAPHLHFATLVCARFDVDNKPSGFAQIIQDHVKGHAAEVQAQARFPIYDGRRNGERTCGGFYGRRRRGQRQAWLAGAGGIGSTREDRFSFRWSIGWLFSGPDGGCGGKRRQQQDGSDIFHRFIYGSQVWVSLMRTSAFWSCHLGWPRSAAALSINLLSTGSVPLSPPVVAAAVALVPAVPLWESVMAL